MKLLLLDVFAVLLAVYAISLLFTSNFNMGNLLVWILAAAVCGYAVWHKALDNWFAAGVGRAAWWVLVAGSVFLAGMLVFVAVSGYLNPATGTEKVVVVLGAGLRKDQPSLLLRYRLDAAYNYAVQHPDVVVVTTGGQGRDETVPEGQAMRDYLVAKGLSPEQVLAETKSTSTEENFRFAADILAERGIAATEPTIYVTNAFHCYRAGGYAKRAGFTDAQALPAGIPLRALPTCYLREVFAVLYYWVFKSAESGPMHAMVGLLDLNKRFFYK
ncbi:MAG: YdcF family protein [Gemmiger sp.]|nr:YdcF family protein [Gemmiger sp.]